MSPLDLHPFRAATIRILLCIGLCLTAGAAAGQEPARSSSVIGSFGERPRHRDTVPVVLSVSGGISKGVYQAGLNWTLLEVFKLTAHDSIRTAWNLPHYELEAMAGASAGNINGFLTAIEWCNTTELTPAEQSLFWQSWMRPGYDQLLPYKDDPARGLLTRRYLDQVILEDLRAKMSSPSSEAPRLECDIPVGVTVTKLTPGRIDISDELDAPTQRFASVVRVSRTGPGPMQFLAPGPKIQNTDRLGRLLLLPTHDGRGIHRDTVFDLVKASSAVPGAFAPVRLQYDVPRGSRDSALFADGGLFDNSPLALAAGIYAVSIRDDPDAADAAILIHMSPLKLRGRYDEAKAALHAKVEEKDGGIGAVVTLISGAVPSALEYELHAFARLLRWAPYVFERANITTTSRAVPMLGEQLGGFGAFLGRPFREFDFYVGVYDALHFFAREACRSDSPIPPDSATQRECIQQRLHAFIDTGEGGVDFGRFTSRTDSLTVVLARRVLRGLYAWEWERTGSTVLASPVRPGPVATPREIILLALLRANLRLADVVVADSLTECNQRDVVKAFLCRDGFRSMLEDFADNDIRRAIDEAVGTREACAPSQWKTSPELCFADESFRAFVRNPERFVVKTIERGLYQLWRVERDIEKQADEGRGDAFAWSGIVTLSEIGFQSSLGYRYRRGFEPNTSSAPRRGHARVLASLVPNYASFSLGSGGFELGYRPTVHLSNSVAVGATVAPLHVVGNAVGDRDAFRWVVGPTLHWKRTDILWSGLSTGVELFGRWGEGPPGAGADHVWAVPITAYFLADKVRLSLRYIPDNDSEVQSGSTVGATLGLSDLNGVLYWALRSIGLMN